MNAAPNAVPPRPDPSDPERVRPAPPFDGGRISLVLAGLTAPRLENLRGYLAGLGATVLSWREESAAEPAPTDTPLVLGTPAPTARPVSEALPHLSVREAMRSGGVIPGLFGRRGIELTNDGATALFDVVVAGLGPAFIGVNLLGAAIPRLEPGQAVPFLFERPPTRSGDLVFRASAETPEGQLFAVNLTLRRVNA